MSEVFTSTLATTLKNTLEKIDRDKNNGESDAVFPSYMEMLKQSDNWEEDLGIAGPGLAAEKTEGDEMDTGTIKEGYPTRYNSRTFALKLLITEETIEDVKYKEAIQSAKMLTRALWKTADYDSANILVRAENAAYTGGDSVSLASASHTLAHGGVYSNTMAVPLAPSRTAVVVAAAAVMKMPGHDGLIEGYELTDVVYQVDQWGVWSELLKSEMDPATGNYSRINVVKNDMSLTPCPVKYWSNTTTNYMFKTSCDNGINFRWRVKPRSRSWVDEGKTVMAFSIRARWSRGWTNPRGVYFVGA